MTAYIYAKIENEAQLSYPIFSEISMYLWLPLQVISQTWIERVLPAFLLFAVL